MENAINTLRIQNFKSIKDVTMQPRRVNLIIGQPNVGKSNVLEAISLLGAGLYERDKKFLNDIIRYESISNLFYDNDSSQPILVESSQAKAILNAKEKGNNGYKFTQASESIIQGTTKHEIHESLKDTVSETSMSSPILNALTKTFSDIMRLDGLLKQAKESGNPYIFTELHIQENGDTSGFRADYSTPSLLTKKYVFRSGQPHEHTYHYSFLAPPLGVNLWEVVQRNPLLRKEIGTLFRPYGLSLVLRVGERKFEIQKQVDDLVYNYPYSLIADTLQRIIFYLVAIESNDDSVLLFEEPEAHSYPVYVSMLGRLMVESRNNQFFVATHSPYLFTEVVEQMLEDEKQAKELAIFVLYYEDYQTKVKQLSDEEIRDIHNDGIDVFYNMSRFTPGSNLYA